MVAAIAAVSADGAVAVALADAVKAVQARCLAAYIRVVAAVATRRFITFIT